MGDSPKWVKSRRRRKKRRERGAKVGENNGQATHGARKHAWRTQAAWANRDPKREPNREPNRKTNGETNGEQWTYHQMENQTENKLRSKLTHRLSLTLQYFNAVENKIPTHSNPDQSSSLPFSMPACFVLVLHNGQPAPSQANSLGWATVDLGLLPWKHHALTGCDILC